jgi:PP-loop superfamily ATP-utilizing enzyme
MRMKFVIGKEEVIEITYANKTTKLKVDVYFNLTRTPFTTDIDEAKVLDTQEEAEIIIENMGLTNFKPIELPYPEVGVK